MRIEIGVPDFTALMGGVEDGIARAATAAMRTTTVDAKRELREQVTSNGLGQKLANSWQSEVYPDKAGRVSIVPTGVIESKAPNIINSFVRGATINPVGGAKYLWIPTDNVPRARGRVSVRGKNLKGGAMTPQEVELEFGAKLQLRPGKNGNFLALIEVIKSRNLKTYRKATDRRKKQGRAPKLVLMFVLVRTVRLPKLLDLNGPARRWADAFGVEFEANLRRIN